MELSLLAFASASDAFGFSSRTVTCSPDDTPLEIVRRMFPDFTPDHLRVALDQEFASWDTPVGQSGELAFIPPVSGG